MRVLLFELETHGAVMRCRRMFARSRRRLPRPRQTSIERRLAQR